MTKKLKEEKSESFSRKITLTHYLLMQASLYGSPSPTMKAMNVEQAKEAADQILKLNNIEVEK